MRDFDAIAALRGDGLRPELRALLDRAAAARGTELFVNADGMLQSGPDATAGQNVVPLLRREPAPKADEGSETTAAGPAKAASVIAITASARRLQR